MDTPARKTLRRALAGSFLAAALLATPVIDTPASAERRTESTITVRRMTHHQQVVVGQINRDRRSRDRRTLATNGLMNQKAMRWAQHLASCNCLEHRAAPYGSPRGWCAAAENVGRSGNGGTLRSVHGAFMRSSHHKANILNGRYTDLGVGVARDRAGEYFVVHAFADLAC